MYKTITHGSKIGIHALRPARSMEYVEELHARGGRFPVVKAVDDVDWLIDVKKLDANIITIARFELPHDNEGLNGIEKITNDDFSDWVKKLFDPIRAKLQVRPELRGAVDYWEICNEPAPEVRHPRGYSNLAKAMIACCEEADQMKIKIACFALNLGTPEWWNMKEMVETGVFGRMKQGGHIMTWHDGILGDPIKGWIHPMDQWYGHPIPADPDAKQWVQLHDDKLIFHNSKPKVENFDKNRTAAGSWAFRYRFLYHLLKQRGEVVPLVISESYYGYKSAHQAVTHAKWYDEQTRRDSFLLSHTPFTLGATSGWKKQDYVFAYQGFIEYMLGERGKANDATDWYNQQGHHDTGSGSGGNSGGNTAPARKNVTRVYNLLPANTTLAEFWLAVQMAYETKETIGFSADDAGELVHTGNERSRVVAWSPERIGTGLTQTWFNQNYPGVTMMRKWYGAPGSPAAAAATKAVARASLADKPRIRRVYNLLPQDATLAEYWEVAKQTFESKETIGFSADDAGQLIQNANAASRVIAWSPERIGTGLTQAWFDQNYKGAKMGSKKL